MSHNPLVVLAFSGGLDTSYCVPMLIKHGYDVHTLFVDTGGTSDVEHSFIKERSKELGAIGHTSYDASGELWDEFVVPFIMGGARYQDRYPLLCSDRYVISAALARKAKELNAAAIAHGCTAMGNDQFRFDQSIRSLTNLPIIAPIRQLQAITNSPRAYELEYLQSLGFSVSAEAKRYTINENILGVTASGAEIDDLDAPEDSSRRLTKPRADWPDEPLSVTIGFESGRPVTLNGEAFAGPKILSTLNQQFGRYGVGRGIYTGDTIVGLKGRIVYECPGIEVLLAAHKALEELTLTQAQNEFKPVAAREWTNLVFNGLFFEPLRSNLDGFIASTQANVTGEVTVETQGGSCLAVAVATSCALMEEGAVYAQKANWSASDAEGFIKIAGNASAIGAAALLRREVKPMAHVTA